MFFLFKFFKKYSFLILFFLLQSISFFFIFNSSVFHQTYFNRLIINFNGTYNFYCDKIISYLYLEQVNDFLIKENNELKSMLYGTLKVDSIKIRKIKDSIRPYQQYEFVSGIVLSNQLIYKNNFYYINRGKKHKIRPDMGVISNKGIAGQVVEVTENYSKVMSLLNSKIRVNARLKNTKYFGILLWIADDVRLMHLYDIPKYVNVKIGDTLETENSIVFPDGIPIGKISGKYIQEKTGSWDISVELFQEMAQLYRVNIVRNIFLINHLKPKNDQIID